MRLFLSLLFILTLGACHDSQRIPENFDYGKIENGVYKNDFFGFDLPIPADWVVEDKEQTKKIGEEGRKIVSEHNKELGEKIKASEVNSAVLLSVFKYKEDSIIGQYNPSFGIVIENLGKFSAVKTAKDYLGNAKTLMQQSGISYQFQPEFTSPKLGNKEFALMELTAKYKGDIDVGQLYFVAIEKRFAISIVASFGNDEQKEKLREILGNIQFR